MSINKGKKVQNKRDAIRNSNPLSKLAESKSWITHIILQATLDYCEEYLADLRTKTQLIEQLQEIELSNFDITRLLKKLDGLKGNNNA